MTKFFNRSLIFFFFLKDHHVYWCWIIYYVIREKFRNYLRTVVEKVSQPELKHVDSRAWLVFRSCETLSSSYILHSIKWIWKLFLHSQENYNCDGLTWHLENQWLTEIKARMPWFWSQLWPQQCWSFLICKMRRLG